MKSKNALLRAAFLISFLVLLLCLLQRAPEQPPESTEKLESSETPLWQKHQFGEDPVSPLDRKGPGPKVEREGPVGRDESDITFSEDKLATIFDQAKEDSHSERWGLCGIAIVLAAGLAIFKVRRSRRQPGKPKMRRRELSAAEWAATRRPAKSVRP